MNPTRREILKGAAAGAAAAGLGASGLADALRRALAAPAMAGQLSDIEHVVILIQENRSFDHYFGSFHGSRGFNEYTNASPWVQTYTPADFAASGATVMPHNPGRPFHLDTATTRAACTHDIDHQWITQHRTWNHGKLDRYLGEHIAIDEYTYDTSLGKVANGPMTMGYYTRQDLGFYYALADNFTLCDNFFTSCIGGSAPCWVYAFTGTIDPAGAKGGPIMVTPSQQDDILKYRNSCSWTTMPEQLRAKGVSWKIYGSTDIAVPLLNGNYMVYFKQYYTDPGLAVPAFTNAGWVGSQPVQFAADVAAGNLPQVSWLIAPEVWSEHAPTPPSFGEDMVANVLNALTANPAVWSKTALFLTWDDSGGWFDHVAPPTAPPGTPGEYITASDALIADRLAVASAPPEGRQPIGLGPRVPLLVISPFARNSNPATGPLISSDVFDQTSLLRFLEARFGAEVPNLSAWRRSTVGDLTSAFNFAAPDVSAPSLPATGLTDATRPECVLAVSDTSGNHGAPLPYDVPAGGAPIREPLTPGQSVKRPSGRVAAAGTPSPAPSPRQLPGTSAAGSGTPGALEVAGLAALAAGAWWARRRAAGKGTSPVDGDSGQGGGT